MRKSVRLLQLSRGEVIQCQWKVGDGGEKPCKENELMGSCQKSGGRKV